MKRIYHLSLFIFQYCFYYFITPLAYLLYKNKHPWIISERGDDARDNGYAFLKFLHDERMSFINAYYLIDKKSVDYSRVKQIGEVVKYKSLKHWLLYRVAECRMSSHLSAFAPGNYIGEWFKYHKHQSIDVFLQHGVNHNDYPSNHYEYNGCDLFICGAKPEYDYFKKIGNYPDGNIVYTGLPRFDYLHDYETKNQILVMPTWRNYLKGVSKKEFIDSDYFMHYDSLLRNKDLSKYLQNNNIDLVFYIHYSLQPYVDCFKGYGPNVIIADFDHYDVQTLLKESKLLITDYSSIFFDFAYMRKPLIYYQFDQKDFYNIHLHRGYFYHERDGFGEVVYDEKSLVKTLFTYNNLEPKKEYLERADQFFPFYDTNNSKRVFNAIIGKYIERLNINKKKQKPTYIMFSADDYGADYPQTSGIVKAVENKSVQKVSTIVNMFNVFDGINTIKESDVSVALHFNILDGKSLFDGSPFDNNSIFKKEVLSKQSFFRLSKETKAFLKNEFIAQHNAFIKLGFEPTVFDSHGNILNKLPIARTIIPVAKDLGYKYVRIPSNTKSSSTITKLYKFFVARKYKRHFITADYFFSCYSLLHINLNKYGGKTLEVMMHPFITNGVYENRHDVSFDSSKNYLNKYNIECINCGGFTKVRR